MSDHFAYPLALMAPSPSLARKFKPLSEFIRARVHDGLIPGAVVAAGRRGRLVYHGAYGHRSLRPRREPMTVTTIFDLASLTKVMATAPVLVEHAARGAFSLLDPVERHLPEMAGTEAGRVPLHRLLTHTGGFVADNPLSDYAGGKRALFAAIGREPLEAPPGTRFTYSDVGYVLAQGVAERRLRKRLDALAADLLFEPLRFRNTRFGTKRKDRGRIAPTERVDGSWLRGTVHDPRARTRALEGVGGHAGMFGTAREVARFCEMILRRGTLGRRRILAEETVRAMTTDQCEGNLGVRRGFGFDIESPYSAPRGAIFSRASFGHSGWTGVSLWIDPEMNAYLVLLTNAVHPDGHKDLKSFRYDAATLAARALR
jgi:CubicO group peptidase (beta-lactamase class C family)